MNNSQFISIQELANILGISRSAVYKRVKKGQIMAMKIGRNFAIPKKYVAHILGKALSEKDKQNINRAIKKTFKEWNVPGSKPETERILAKIDTIRTRLLQESAENIKVDMDEARANLNKRFYSKASQKFKDILKIVDNEDLKRYVDRNRKVAALLQEVKERLVIALNKELN